MQKTTFAKKERHSKLQEKHDERSRQLQEKQKERSRRGGGDCDGGDFVPLIYELDVETEFNLLESELRARRGVLGALSSLKSDISKVQAELIQKRDARINGWKKHGTKFGVDWKKHGTEQCHKAIEERSGSSEVYTAVFKTIADPDGAEMYEKAAEALQKEGDQWPQCKQKTTDLAKLYMEAVSVRNYTGRVMEGLRNGNARFELRLSPLKGMRCVLQASMPCCHLALPVSCVRRCSRACEKMVLQPSSDCPGAERICDIVRMMAVCKTPRDMATLLDQIRESDDIKVVRFKDRVKTPSGGWRDAMINFCVNTKDFAYPHHICEVQIVHRKMAVCRQKDGLGGHDEYAEERNAREILEHLGLSPPDSAEAATFLEQVEQLKKEVRASRADAEKGKAVAEAVITWVRQRKLQLNSFRIGIGKWANRSKIRAATKTAPAPVLRAP